MTAMTLDHPTNDTLNDAIDHDQKKPRRFSLKRLLAKRHLRRKHKRLRPRGLRRQLKRLNLTEPQLDCALRIQQQLDALRATADQQRRQMGWQLLGVVLDPDQRRQQAMLSVSQLTRTIDEKAAELIMTLADLGEQLTAEQHQALKRWLMHG